MVFLKRRLHHRLPGPQIHHNFVTLSDWSARKRTEGAESLPGAEIAKRSKSNGDPRLFFVAERFTAEVATASWPALANAVVHAAKKLP